MGYVGLLAVFIGLLACPVIVAIAYRSFGGLTGDVFGALNDLTRVTTLLAFIVLI
ncbi:MAG: adenosylcobinamide-GDP ribazoletransferase [Thaumarchaeota archaeon]|nr:adenosylcobinamide-GDP ribazoletransferase [Nitrososphaerota archaeon]